jgi:cytochrome c peroxidase
MRRFLVYALPVVAMLGSVSGWPQQNVLGAPLPGLDVYMPLPANGSLRREVVELGQALFFDPILSLDSTVACADCHRPELGFTNRRATSVGVEDRQGTRNVPAIFNRAYGRAFFWDGRIESLEEQVLQPIMAEDEMALELDEAIERLATDGRYSGRFNEAFGRTVNRTDLANALASFVRTIQAGGSLFDCFNAGDSTALNEQQRMGLDIFQGKGRCVRCHAGTNLTDESFHNTGVAWRDGVFQDEGRAIVTGESGDRGRFKTPTLREVSRTAPYMHDGSFPTLEEVVDFYSDGGRANPNLDAELRPFNLAPDEKLALVAFLESLSGNIRSGL